MTDEISELKKGIETLKLRNETINKILLKIINELNSDKKQIMVIQERDPNKDLND